MPWCVLSCLFGSRIDLQVETGSASCLGLWEEGQLVVPTEATIILLGGCDSLHSDCTCSRVSASTLAPVLGSIPARKRWRGEMVGGGCLFCSFCTWLCRLLVGQVWLALSSRGLLFVLASVPSHVFHSQPHNPNLQPLLLLAVRCVPFLSVSCTVCSFVKQTPEVVNLMWGQPLRK